MGGLDASERDRLIRNHPLVIQRYSILTPMVQRAYSLLRERVWMRHSGVFMYAASRMGKTTCAEMVKALLLGEFVDRFVIYHIADRHRSASFMRDLVVSAGLPIPEKISYSVLMEKFLIHIMAQALSLNGSHFVLIIDEMQNLSLEQYGVLQVIHNRLAEKGISMTTIGFAIPEIMHRRQLLFDSNATNLVARFLSEPIQFDGCQSSADFQSILNQFDYVKVYPENSGWTYTQFFLPQAYHAGFKLCLNHQAIWGALAERISPARMDRVPIVFLFRIVEYILIRGAKNDQELYVLDTGQINEAIKKSLVVDFMELMKNAPEFE